MASLEQLETALRNADAAGDADAARTLAGEIVRMRNAPKESKDDGRNTVLGKIDSAVRGAADTLTFGLADEFAAGMGALTGIGGTFGDYSGNLARQRGVDKADADQRTASRIAGQILGGVGGGVGLARAGLSAGANAAQAGRGLARTAAGSAADGMVLGGSHGFGSGEGTEGRIGGALAGAAGGTVLGVAAPYAVAGVSAAAQPFVSPIMARLRPDVYAERALGEGLRRSGHSADDVASSLRAAADDDQGMFNVADAMGHAGQRMLSTVARTPSDMRQTVINFLTGRQMGQGDRLSSFLAEGFGAPDTAAQRLATLTAQRRASANVGYGAAREGAGPVDPTAAIQAADDFITPGVGRMMSQTDIADDSVEAAVRRARSYLTDGQSVLTDFNAALRSKQEIDAMIERAGGTVQRQLIPIRNALDSALETASPGYAQARNAYREQSRAIDAIDTGRNAASGRMRSADTIPQFGAMNANEQSAFRAGYADPLIARIEAMSASPTTNKARPLITPKTEAEFPAFALPERADQLGSRIAREQRMFETSSAAMGGSKTADNLADAADMSRFDPSIMANLLRGRPIQAAVDAVTRLANEARGMPPSVVNRIAEALIETRPDVARRLLTSSSGRTSSNDMRRAIANAILTNSGAVASGRLAP